MSVVKTLGLGLSMMGCLVAPTLAGSIRASHHVPERHHRAVLPDLPTSLIVAQPVVAQPVAAQPVAFQPVAPVNASQENLANPGGWQPMQAFSNFARSAPVASTAPLALGYSNAGAIAAPQPLAVAPAYTAPVAPAYTTPVAPAYTAPVAPAYTAPVAPASIAPVAAAPAASSIIAAASTAASTGHNVDAFINFGNSSYSEAQSLTTGNPQAWYQSSTVQSVFHGTPTTAQQASFTNEVLQVIQHTYNQSGLNVSVTTDPSQNYAHTMSVVSGASYSGNSNAIGITDVGNDGFSFIDKFGMAKTPDELAEAVGHNLAHELMHAFGIAGHPDQTGTYLDAASANWNVLTNAQTSFSPQAAQMLAAQNFLTGPGKEFTQGSLGVSGLELLTEHHPTFCNCPYCSALHKLKAAEGLSVGGASPVPEPTTVALWGFAVVTAAVVQRRARRRVEKSAV